MTALLEWTTGLDEWMEEYAIGYLTDEDLDELAKEEELNND